MPYFQVFNETTRQGIFCGTNLHDTHKSHAGWRLYILFHSDLTVAGGGFNATYVQEYGKFFLYCLTHTHTHARMHTHARTHTHTHTHTHARMHTHARTHTHTRSLARTHIHTHARTLARTNTHTQTKFGMSV